MTIAKWVSKTGKHWVELNLTDSGYSYKAPDCSGYTLPDFLRVPTRADLQFIPLPKPLPEPHYYRRELDRPRTILGSEILGLCALAGMVGFILGYWLAS